MDGQGTERRKNCRKFQSAEYGDDFDERYRQTTDGTAIAYSEPERKFTFAKKPTICPLPGSAGNRYKLTQHNNITVITTQGNIPTVLYPYGIVYPIM